ncbi:MAG: [Fe-Fe] hydrogenase large subunit C-terminal domain-containing protein [Patescibacteria group bacterium]|nr:hypothetical protein [Patescibacteria group bacterium]
MSGIEKFYKLLRNKTPLVCMLAPSFIADFDYPEIIWKLQALGFDKVVELTFGAKMTNIFYHKVIKEDKSKSWIASPCPTLVQLIKNKYPHLVGNLVPVHSPMGCMSLICRKFYPKHRIVFIGPCISKKVESAEIGSVDLALTYRELEEIFKNKKVGNGRKKKLTFNKFYNDYTKIYPLPGGLSDTLHYKGILKKSEILIEDGIDKITKILDNMKGPKYKNYLFLDFLSCRDGCIGGPGMTVIGTIEEKTDRVLKYREFARRSEKDLGRRGKIVHVDDIDFSRKI